MAIDQQNAKAEAHFTPLFPEEKWSKHEPSSKIPRIILAWVLYGAWILYVYLMPVYVPYLNTHYTNSTCTTPTWQLEHQNNITCVNGDNLTKLAISRGRFNGLGQPVACGCGEGIFGEDICPIGFWASGNYAGVEPNHAPNGSFSVSNYIGTPTGSASFVLFTIGLVAVAWIYGSGSSFWQEQPAKKGVFFGVDLNKKTGIDWDHWFDILAKLSLLLGTLLFFAFYFATGCIFYDLHVGLLDPLTISMGIHFLLVATLAFSKGHYKPGAVFVTAIALLLVCLYVGSQTVPQFGACNIIPWQPGRNGTVPGIDCKKVLANPYRGFYVEASLITIGFGVAPVLIAVSG